MDASEEAPEADVEAPDADVEAPHTNEVPSRVRARRSVPHLQGTLRGSQASRRRIWSKTVT
eukprot:scaffold1724_cov246-Pinguiococcus_pyrenoidosus.AAC.9